jgi:hypothetical protein
MFHLLQRCLGTQEDYGAGRQELFFRDGNNFLLENKDMTVFGFHWAAYSADTCSTCRFSAAHNRMFVYSLAIQFKICLFWEPDILQSVFFMLWQRIKLRTVFTDTV